MKRLRRLYSHEPSYLVPHSVATALGQEMAIVSGLHSHSRHPIDNMTGYLTAGWETSLPSTRVEGSYSSTVPRVKHIRRHTQSRLISRIIAITATADNDNGQGQFSRSVSAREPTTLLNL
jgi:hypothetical protein